MNWFMPFPKAIGAAAHDTLHQFQTVIVNEGSIGRNLLCCRYPALPRPGGEHCAHVVASAARSVVGLEVLLKRSRKGLFSLG